MRRTDLSDLRLGFLSGRGSTLKDGGLYVDAGLGRLIDALKERAPQLRVALSRGLPEQREIHDHRLSIRAEDVILFPAMRSYARAIYKVRPCRRVIHELEALCEVMVVQLPFQAPAALFGARRPRVYHVCSDVRGLASVSPSYQGARRVAALSVAFGIEWVQQRLVHARETRLVTNGTELFQRYGGENGRAVVSSSILDSEILGIPRTRPADAPFRVVFVGYLRPEKGVDTLLDAFESVRRELPDAELSIVGARPLVDRLAHLHRRIEVLTASGAIRFAGQVPFGPELFRVFADADVLALPSLSEGTPRVLVEARAFGCPVIATDVGGIPTSVTNEKDGLLVPPGDGPALARAILRVARDPMLRATLVQEGIARARRSTVQAFADQILDEVRVLCTSQRPT